MAARRRNRNVPGWVLLGLVTGPVAWAVVAILHPLEQKPKKPIKTKYRIRAYSEGLWRLTLALTTAVPGAVWLFLLLLDDQRILSVSDDEIFVSGLLVIPLPYITVKVWLWIRRGYEQDRPSPSAPKVGRPG